MTSSTRPKRPVGPLETVMGIIILLAAAVAGLLLWRDSKIYDPDLYALNPQFLQAPSADSGPSGNISSAEQVLKHLAKKPQLQAGDLESFEPDNLWEKIDGKDGAFLSYGFAHLHVMNFIPAQTPDSWFDAFIYDMGGAYNAFGVYASLHMGNENPWQHNNVKGVQSGNSVSFYTGRYYVTLVGSAAQPELMEQMNAAAQALAEQLPTEPINLWAFEVFPDEGLIENSIGYRSSNFLASDFFGDVFTARYEADGAELTAYLSKRENSEEAANLFNRIREFFNLMQAKTSEVEPAGDAAALFTAENYGLYDVVFHDGVWVGGVTEADDAAKARAVAEQLRKSLPGK